MTGNDNGSADRSPQMCTATLRVIGLLCDYNFSPAEVGAICLSAYVLSGAEDDEHIANEVRRKANLIALQLMHSIEEGEALPLPHM